MKKIRYRCSHCGHRFEDEEKEVLECTKCFWSTSVKKDEGSASPDSDPVPAAQSKPRQKKPIGPFPWKAILVFLAIAALIFILIRIVPGFFKPSGEKKVQTASQTKSPATISLKPDKSSPAAKSPEAQPFVSEIEKEILNQQLTLQEAQKAAQEERDILAAHIDFSTGIVERLPYQIWSLEKFEEMLTAQEAYYKVPLPRSYRKTLLKHIEETYLPGKTAFEQGDLLGARDAWVRTLAFPVYANDLRKHQGVVLTMIRGFINDTLSKIGSVNSTLAEKDIRDQEQQISFEYQKLHDAIGRSSWQEALSDIQSIRSQLNVLNRPSGQVTVPPYPQTAGVDPGIQAALFDMLTPPAPARADYDPMLRDLEAKESVIKGFQPEAAAQNYEHYKQAISAIRSENWNEARALLNKINAPRKLVSDAKEKLKIINKIQQA